MARLLLLLLSTFLEAAELTSAARFWDNLKLDCDVSVWSDWGPTINRSRTRTRQIYRQPQNGGAPCPKLSETDNDPWVYETIAVKASTIQTSFQWRPSRSPSGRECRQTEVADRDILFILDSSGSISDTDFDITRGNLVKFIGKICGTIGPGKGSNRAALIIYSGKPEEIFDFDDYTNLEAMQRAILNFPRITGRERCTGDALEFAKTMFTPGKGMRPDLDSVKEVVVLTGGNTNCGADVVLKARDLQNNTTMFAFAVGHYGSQGRKEIERIVSRPISRHLFHVLNFTEFRQVVDEIKNDPACVRIDFD